MKINHWLIILHLLIILVYYLSVISKSLSEQQYIDSEVSNGARKVYVYNISLFYYSINVWLAFITQLILVYIIS